MLESLKDYTIQLKHFCNASNWSIDDLEAMQVHAERLLGFIIQIQAHYPNVNGIDDLKETVRVILDKVVQEVHISGDPIELYTSRRLQIQGKGCT